MNSPFNTCIPITPHKTKISGFTLIELMVVIVIVGIMFSFLALSVRSNTPAEAIKTEALKLNQLIKIALEQAVLRGEEYAIVFKPNSYEFARLDTSKIPERWQLIKNDRLLRKRVLPHEITMELEFSESEYSFSLESKISKVDIVSKKKDKQTKIEPQVFLLSSSEITPEFTVNMGIIGVNTHYRIIGEASGKHSASSDDY